MISCFSVSPSLPPAFLSFLLFSPFGLSSNVLMPFSFLFFRKYIYIYTYIYIHLSLYLVDIHLKNISELRQENKMNRNDPISLLSDVVD